MTGTAAVPAARDEMLARIRRALEPSQPPPEVPRLYRQPGLSAPGSTELVARFCARVEDYRARVLRADDGLEETLAAACESRGSRRLAAAPAATWTVPGIEIIPDGPQVPVAALDGVDGALTGCALAIAETGTIALDGGSLSGRRALSLVPDHHICVVRVDQIVADVPDAINALADTVRTGQPITFVSGPSATSDIELHRVEGVHGPRRLDVVIGESP